MEKLVHVENPALLPDDWRRQEGPAQQRGDDWHKARSSPLLEVPSAIVHFAGSPDANLLINHNHPAAAVEVATGGLQ